VQIWRYDGGLAERANQRDKDFPATKTCAAVLGLDIWRNALDDIRRDAAVLNVVDPDDWHSIAAGRSWLHNAIGDSSLVD
jgi:hypothetical protein